MHIHNKKQFSFVKKTSIIMIMIMKDIWIKKYYLEVIRWMW